MNSLTDHAIGLIVAALLFVPLSPATVRADDDDDDWEDRWEEYEDDWDDDDDDRWTRGHRHRHYGYRTYYYPERYYYGDRGRRYYRYDDLPRHRVYRYYDAHPRYYYGGHVRGGPVDVYYGRHGEVRLGPFSVYW
jgi:hypothetical protein